VAVADLDNDGYMDMVLGNFSGGLTYYKGIIPTGNVGIDETDADIPVNFSIFPNPVSGKLFINIGDNNRNHLKIEIFDLIGQKILEKEFNNTSNPEINMQPYQPGFYLCNLQTVDKQGKLHPAGTKKFIISR